MNPAEAARRLAPGRVAVLWTEAGALLPRRLAALAGVDAVFAHAPAGQAETGALVPVLLGGADVDVPGRRAGLWPGGEIARLQRVRQIDTLYADHPVGLIVLAAPGAAAVLAGARETIRRHRPNLLLIGQAASLASALPGPQEEIEGGVAIGTAGPVPPPGADDGAVVLAFDTGLPAAGLHPPEHDAPNGGRWTGAAPWAWFLLPTPGPGPWRLRLDVADWGNAGAGFALRIGAVVVQPVVLGGMSAVYAPLFFAPEQDSVQVWLLLPPALRDMLRGPRRIGVRLLRACLFAMRP